MWLKATDGSYGVHVDTCGQFLYLEQMLQELSIDREQAQQLLPILEHFIKTGELPDAS